MMYILYINLALIVLYLSTVIPFRRFTFHWINRIILLTIPLITLLIPFIKLTGINEVAAILLPVIAINPSDIITTGVSISEIFRYVFFIGMLMSFILLIVKSIKLITFTVAQNYVKYGAVEIASGSSKMSSFSFGKWIYINSVDQNNFKTIIEHEKWHYHLNHAFDNVLYELLKCIFWFNPTIYLMHKDLRNNHEYQVDALMNLNSNEEDYINTVTQGNSQMNEFILANSFNANSNLLKRINMMTRKSTDKHKKIIYLSLLPAIALSMMLIACSEESIQSTDPINTKDEVISGNEVKNLTVQPSFTGGMQYFAAFLGEEIKYPEIAKDEGIEGTVHVSFVVDRDGKIKDISVLKKIHPLLDAEAVRAISEMPDWVPGEKEGSKVSVEFVVPIAFKLSAEEKSLDEKDSSPLPPLPTAD